MGKNINWGSFGDKLPKELHQSNNQKQPDNNVIQKGKDLSDDNKQSFNFKPLTEDNLANMISNAEIIAKKIADEKDSYTQIRKFYDELLLLQKQVKYNDYKKIEPMICLLKSKSAYAHGRKNIHDTFFKFITKYIDYIKNTKDLDNFILYFEAVLGYLKYYTK